jgi:nitrite reductase/ring-hydroxylating ferredoxin subunit
MDDNEDKSAQEMTRRECLAWLARAAALGVVVAQTGRCAFGEDAGDSKGGGMVKIADLCSVKNSHACEIEKPNVILSRTNDGVACMSITCTHRRNKLNVEKDGSIACPVHNSTFDLSGKPTGGPATRALTWYKTAVSDEGAISVDTSKTVEQGKWAELPDWAKPKKK